MRRTSLVIAAVLMLAVALGVLVVAQGSPVQGGSYLRALVTSGRDLREWDDQVTSMVRDRDLRLRATQVDTIVAGRLHERYDQYYKGIPVFGGEAIRETDGQLTMSVTASIYKGIDVDTAPALSASAAAQVFQRETGATADARLSPELMVLPRADGTYALAYRVSAFVDHAMPVLFVNAATGAVEHRYNNLKSQQASALVGNGVLAGESLVSSDQKKVSCAVSSGTYVAWDMMRPTTIRTFDLKGNLTKAKNLFDAKVAISTNDLAANSAATWIDSVVVDAHTYVGWAYDYFYARHGWKGLNGKDGRPVYVFVHPANRSDFASASYDDQGTFYMNAFFCGGCGSNREDMLMLGEGLPSNYYATANGGQKVDYFAAAFDIVAHEYTHGVTDYAVGLIYENESGALSEAFSDIMSVGAEFYQQPAGSGLLQADYLEGEDAWRPAKAGALSGIRSLQNPLAYGDPDHYSKRYIGTDDNGGVHINSTIVSHAFYLAVEGGTNQTSGLKVTGVGAANRDKIEKVFFRGFALGLTSNATFSLARATTIQAAQALYGAGSAVETAIVQAWNAVGVN